MTTTPPPILILNPKKRTQLFWQTTWIPLTPTQYRVLRLLAENPNQVIPADLIYNVIVNGQTIIEPAQVTWHISQLKSTTLALSGFPLPIQNIPERGYILDLPETSIILVPEATDETT